MTHFKNRWFSSDHHLGHANIIKFTNNDGTRIRPEFDSVEEMNEHIIEQHNKVVKPQDSVYFLGDFVINRRFMELASRFNGKLRLVKGNHDIFKLKEYSEFFDDIMSCKVFVDNFICTHIPVHPQQISERWKANVHGHLHANVLDDPRYLNVSMEQLDDYTPRNFDEIVEIFKQRGV